MGGGNISGKASFPYYIPASHVEMSATSLFTRTNTDFSILFEDGDFTVAALLFAAGNIGFASFGWDGFLLIAVPLFASGNIGFASFGVFYGCDGNYIILGSAQSLFPMRWER